MEFSSNLQWTSDQSDAGQASEWTPRQPLAHDLGIEKTAKKTDSKMMAGKGFKPTT
ncbi:hypothetical protein PAXRUDRAFT_831225 [Paxillus rubicundulus Ve08.2h10]|uniref:Uncharacterized protein n=1 Tax=Paxillus rubicundulus Ve08.2h10 TaxID=930991 RepID=A0A0D0DXE6_9AGAM|nr:hypothetical protein PAXRUDRAFT_831225 [Paxillus rubicundulus Ve08.2h10]